MSVIVERVMAKVEFYFDVLSPYSYVAFKQLQRLKIPWGLTIEHLPVNLPYIIKERHNTPPASVPARAAFLVQDLRRAYNLLGLCFNPPSDFLKTPMQGARLVMTAATKLGWSEDLKERLLEVLWTEFFDKGNRDPFTKDPKDLKDLLRGFPQSEELIRMAEGEEAQKELDTNTQNALKAGAFGVPTMIITKDTDTQGELFFGSDRFHHIAVFLSQNPTDIFLKGAGPSKI